MKFSIFNFQFSILKNGFTLVELIVIVGTMLVLLALAVPSYRLFEREADLSNTLEEIVNKLRTAQNKTSASEGASKWGVYFATSTNQYVLFKGNNYASRTSSFDEVHKIKQTIEIFNVSLAGGNEVVFDRITGKTAQTGQISLRLKSDPSKTKTIYVENSGQVGLTATSTPSDANRKKDSRHIHFDYSRQISTSTEILNLTFIYDSTTTIKDIVIAENLKNNQIYWEGEVNVGGNIQKLKIHTHKLNDPILGSQFSIHRDRRYNNKALTVEINGTPDPDIGTLISYTASGESSTGTSTYVSNLQIQ